MAPTQASGTLDNGHVGPHPSFIQVAKPYLFEQKIQECVAATGAAEAKEVTNRMQGIAWIDSARRALHLYEVTCSCFKTSSSANSLTDLYEHIILPLSIFTNSAFTRIASSLISL